MEDITKRELAERLAVSPDTIKRCKNSLIRKGCLPIEPASSITENIKGITLSHELLAVKGLSLEAKVLYSVILRDIGGRNFTTIQSAEIIRLTGAGIGKSTIPRLLNKLEKRKYVWVVRVNRMLKNPKTKKPLHHQRITGFRYIYLDETLANEHKQALERLKRNKRPVEYTFNLYVMQKGVNATLESIFFRRFESFFFFSVC